MRHIEMLGLTASGDLSPAIMLDVTISATAQTLENAGTDLLEALNLIGDSQGAVLLVQGIIAAMNENVHFAAAGLTLAVPDLTILPQDPEKPAGDQETGQSDVVQAHVAPGEDIRAGAVVSRNADGSVREADDSFAPVVPRTGQQQPVHGRVRGRR